VSFAVAPHLVEDVDLLCLDAGNTVIFLDHARLAGLSGECGFPVETSVLVRTEGEAKIRAELGTLVDFAWQEQSLPGARGWGKMVGTILHLAGFPHEELAPAISRIWADHVRWNLWSLVPPGLAEALAALRATGARVAVVSNSEGMLEPLFEKLGILSSFDAVIDSGKVGVEKPDPRIFTIAMDRCQASANRSLHLGDMFATDTLGARAANIRTALIDPYDHLRGRHADVPRVPGATETALAITAARGKNGSA
jgi:HAD superfamily hydrolase (TIGR01549 family)